MADYYPLLAKAVSGLAAPDGAQGAESRRAVYDRARGALLGQLRKIDPPIAEADIAREAQALDEAVARLEGEIAARSAAAFAAEAERAAEPAQVEDAPLPPAPKTPDPAKPGFFSRRRKPAEQPDAEESVAEDDETVLPRLKEPVRPPAFTPPVARRANGGAWAFAAIVAVAALLIGGAAYTLRSKPEDLTALKTPQSEAPAETPVGKMGGRVGAPDGTTQAEQKQAEPQASAPLQVAHRAALLVEAPDVDGKVKTFVGSVVWRLDNVPRGPGQPLGAGVTAEVDIPDAHFRAMFEIQKNTDATLPATHTVAVRFTTQKGGDVPGVKQISNVQMRREEAPEGDPLAGVPVPITDAYHLIGLARGDLEKRNLDLLKSRSWFDLPILMSNGRVAKLTLEKGPSGARVIDDAIAAWEQQK